MNGRRPALVIALLGVTGLISAFSLAPVAGAPAASNPKPRAVLFDKGGAKGDALGSSVAVSGKLLAVGAPGRRVNGHKAQGAVDLFIKPGSGWRHAKLITRLTVANGHRNDGFGFSVAIAGSTIVVGAPRAHPGGSASAGAVYLFSRPVGGWGNAHHPTGQLVPTDRSSTDKFGYALAAHGPTIVVGSPGHVVGFHPGQGAAYVFTRSGRGWFGTHHQQAELSTDEIAPNTQLGYSVAIAGRTIVAGAPYRKVGNNAAQGAAYVFRERVGGWRDASQDAILTATDGASSDFLGTSVAVSGDTVVAGAPYHQVGNQKYEGATYVFVKPAGGWFGTRSQRATLTVKPGGNGAAFFGQGVAAHGRTVIANGSGVDAVFIRPGSGWSGTRHQHSVLTGVGGVANLGKAIAMTAHVVAAGAPAEAIGKHTAQGVVNVFVR